MGHEIENARIAKIAPSLPGAIEDIDTGRGVVLWQPFCDDMSTPGKTVVHTDWQAALGALQTPARDIHDFSFSIDEPSITCPDCDGCGRNKAYAELERGFYGTAKTKRWGDGPFMQNEIDALVASGYLRGARKGEVTPDNLKNYLDPIFGLDAGARDVIIPVRAGNLGISTGDCFKCIGTGKVPVGPASITLNLWTIHADAGNGRADVVRNVRLEEMEEVRAYIREIGWEAIQKRFGWPAGHNMTPEIRYEKNFGIRQDQDRWSDTVRYDSFDAFEDDFGEARLNLVFDYRIVADEAYRSENPFASTELPPSFELHLFMTHPRKAVERRVEIRGCTAEDGSRIKQYLLESYLVHGAHFEWAAGRPFLHGAVDETPDADPTDTMAYFGGISR